MAELAVQGALLGHAFSGSADVHAVAAFVLAATRASVSAGSIVPTDSSAMGSVRGCGETEADVEPYGHPCVRIS
jgi:hypothetical protein